MVKEISKGKKPKPPWATKWECPTCERVIELEASDGGDICPGGVDDRASGGCDYVYNTSNSGRSKHILTHCPTCDEDSYYRLVRAKRVRRIKPVAEAAPESNVEPEETPEYREPSDEELALEPPF